MRSDSLWPPSNSVYGTSKTLLKVILCVLHSQGRHCVSSGPSESLSHAPHPLRRPRPLLNSSGGGFEASVVSGAQSVALCSLLPLGVFAKLQLVPLVLIRLTSDPTATPHSDRWNVSKQLSPSLSPHTVHTVTCEM